MNQTPNIRREPQLPLPLASQSLTFNGVVLMPLSLGGQLWFRSSELARALGYKDENSVRRIYERNADEFTDDMTQVIEILDTVNLTVRVRIFSLRGCHLLAMFAQTPVAKVFRKWVLDVLDRFGERNPIPALSAAPFSPYVFQGVPVRAKSIAGEPWFVVKDVYTAFGLVYSSSSLKKGVYQLPAAWIRIMPERGIHNSHMLTYISFPAVVKMATHTTGNRRGRAWELVRWLVDDVLEKVKSTPESLKESAQDLAESMNAFARAMESARQIGGAR
jgi:prophage antirepressor-like protein